MYVCMCVYMYVVCMYVCMYVCICYLSIYVCVYVYIYVYICTYVSNATGLRLSLTFPVGVALLARDSIRCNTEWIRLQRGTVEAMCTATQK